MTLPAAASPPPADAARAAASRAADAAASDDVPLADEPLLRHVVRTPENVEFTYALAGPAARFAAFLIDSLLSAAIVLVGLLLVAAAQGTTLRDTRVGLGGGLLSFLGLVVVFAAQWGYHIVLEQLLGGQTPGKRLLRLRVLGDDGVRVTLAQSVTRNLLRMIDAFPVAAVLDEAGPLLHLFPLFFLPAAVSVFLSPRAQRIGDLAAGTIVVAEQRRPLPSAIVPPAQRLHHFTEDRRLADALHRDLRPAEADALVTLCLRREALELGARLRLFHRAATLLEERLSLRRPEEMSDEKLVLNLVAVLLESDRARP